MGGLGGDNMSIIIICFLHGKPWQNLVDKCKRIHSEKKASSKLSEPAFSAFDRFTNEGPFAEVSVLKAASDELSNANETSSSSHTSSPSSSSPISTEEKFEIPETSQNNTTTGTASTEIEEEKVIEKILPNSQEEEVVIEEQKSQETAKEIESVKTINEDEVIPSTATISSAVENDEKIVSNGD